MKEERTRSSGKKQRQRQEGNNTPRVRKVDPSITYPSFLSKVNYLAMSSFESSMEDECTHNAYRQAILQNSHLCVNRIVMHLTEGVHCLYSIFAAQAGAQKVYCVVSAKQGTVGEQNKFMISQIVLENGLQDQIEVVLWKEFNAEVDVIIAEPMGYCLHFDGLLDRIIQARQLYLSRGGIMLPDKLSFKCAAIHDEFYSDHKIGFWNKVYGVPMTAMKQWISHEPLIRMVDPSLIVSRVAKVVTFDLKSLTYQQALEMNRSFEVELLSQTMVNGLIFWFEIKFDECAQTVDVKASPWSDGTKFTHASLYWPEIVGYQGGSLRVRIRGQKYPQKGYSILTTEVDDRRYQYSFS